MAIECKQPGLRASTTLSWRESNFPSISAEGRIHRSGEFIAADNRTVGIKSENALGPQKQYHSHMRGNNKAALD